MFALNNQTAKFLSFNPRRELHGDDPKPAADLHFAVNQGGEALRLFDPALRDLLYTRIGDGPPRPLRDLADAGADFPDLRFPQLAALRWTTEIVGATVVIAYGLGGPSDLRMEGCTINKFALDPQQGGTVIIGFRVQCHPNETACAKLCFLIGQSVDVTVTPPVTAEFAPDA
jgi:hypothetical protein